ncbi:MAG: hypothetical protein HY744_03905 [Deltaproteobacteria bacterium]|nr:hypothetical protein [Deltaproteobacteria bacterium]
MDASQAIRAVELVRRIRDELATELVGRSREQLLAFFRQAGDAALAEAKARRAHAPAEPTDRQGDGRPARPA